MRITKSDPRARARIQRGENSLTSQQTMTTGCGGCNQYFEKQGHW